MDKIYTINIMLIKDTYYLYVNGVLNCTCASLEEVHENLVRLGL